jgi:hypothetical protein
MKKLIPFLVLMVGVSGALAQGVVNFNNNVLAEPPDRTVYGVDGSALVGTNFVAQLYYGTDAGSLVAHTGAASRFRVTTTTQPGTWSGGNRTSLVGVSEPRYCCKSAFGTAALALPLTKLVLRVERGARRKCSRTLRH